MKKLSLLFFALLTICNVLAQESVRLTVIGEGKTKEEAIANALRSAIEQAFGVFVSANTQILNDEIVKDEIATIASGNINEYSEIACNTMPNGIKSVSLSATVSIGNLISYAKSKGSSAEFAGALFGMNMKMRRLNKENEARTLSQLITRLDNILDNYGLFDISITIDGKPYKMTSFNQLTEQEGEYYGMYLTLNYKATNNSKGLFNLIFSTLRSIALKNSEMLEYIESNENVFKLSIANNYVYHDRGWASGSYTTDKAESFYFRNNPTQFANGLISVINKAIYSSMLLHIEGIDASYQMKVPTSPNYEIGELCTRLRNDRRQVLLIENKVYSYLIDDRDYDFMRRDQGSLRPSWRELFFKNNPTWDHLILTHSQVPKIFFDNLNYQRDYILYNEKEKRKLNTMDNIKDELECQRVHGDNVFVLCIDNLFDYTNIGQTIYQIKFDFPFSKEELEKTTNIIIKSNYESLKVDEITDNNNEESNDFLKGKPIPFMLVDEKPSFQGGDVNKFSKWVSQNLVYPEKAKASGIQGVVKIQFTINTDGSLSDIKVVNSINPLLDNEAIRIISQSPKWDSGSEDGLPVPVVYTLPVLFSLH